MADEYRYSRRGRRGRPLFGPKHGGQTAVLAETPHPHEIDGHPTVDLITAPDEPPTLLTVCAECGNLRTILFLSKDRWFCFTCKTEGATAPSLYPLA